MWMENVLIIVQNNIVNAERRGKRQVLVRPSSKVIVKFLSVMQRHGMLLLLTLSSSCLVFSRTPSCYIGFGVITTIDEVTSPPAPRFKAPKK